MLKGISAAARPQIEETVQWIARREKQREAGWRKVVLNDLKDNSNESKNNWKPNNSPNQRWNPPIESIGDLNWKDESQSLHTNDGTHRLNQLEI